jgi:hypothetical protein
MSSSVATSPGFSLIQACPTTLAVRSGVPEHLNIRDGGC